MLRDDVTDGMEICARSVTAAAPDDFLFKYENFIEEQFWIFILYYIILYYIILYYIILYYVNVTVTLLSFLFFSLGYFIERKNVI